MKQVKGEGRVDTKENCWKFFIERARKNIKTMLCFSPVGSTLRIRARKFPALVNCTTIDWFMEWPQVALENVSLRFISDLEDLEVCILFSLTLSSHSFSDRTYLEVSLQIDLMLFLPLITYKKSQCSNF